uniref:Uncharacterized protein n=1 Tax=Aegilops tauschii subsp. strangulata TaxID=200361 RepID=A0A452YHU9_AEGTS
TEDRKVTTRFLSVSCDRRPEENPPPPASHLRDPYGRRPRKPPNSGLSLPVASSLLRPVAADRALGILTCSCSGVEGFSGSHFLIFDETGIQGFCAASSSWLSFVIDRRVAF